MASEPPSASRRGRPRAFDADEVVGRALATFWTRGYATTSVDDLSRATGLSVSSLYAAFGSKRGLFEAALARYRAGMDDALRALRDGARGLADVRAFVAWVARGVADPARPPGCLVVNTMAGMGTEDPALAALTAGYRAEVRGALEAAMRRAARLGEIPPRAAPSRALLVNAGLFGALVTARAGDVEGAREMLRALESTLRAQP